MTYVFMTKQQPKYAYLSVQHHLSDIGGGLVPLEWRSTQIKGRAMTFSMKNRLNVPSLMLDNVYIDYV